MQPAVGCTHRQSAVQVSVRSSGVFFGSDTLRTIPTRQRTAAVSIAVVVEPVICAASVPPVPPATCRWMLKMSAAIEVPAVMAK